MRQIAIVGSLVGCIAFGLPATADAARRSYAGWSLVSVDVASDAELARLLELGVDPWVDHPRKGAMPVLASPAQRDAIARAGWPMRTIVDDVQRQLDDEHERLALRVPPQEGGTYFADFRDLDEVYTQLDAMAAANPELVTVGEIGMSLEDRPIRALWIAAGGVDDRPTIVITAGQHAREWISVTSAMYLADDFVAHADEAMYSEALAAVQIVIVPVVNPDGYAFTWIGDRLWRKNRRDGVGVDTNRNFGWGWGGEGASMVPEEQNYAGTSAFSEPESQVVRDFVLAHDELVAHVDLHSFGELVLYPWGDIYEPAPDDVELSATAVAIADAMNASGSTYTPLQGVNLYPAAGNAIDWTYGEAGLHALTIELRPADVDEFEEGFLLGADQIAPVGDEVVAGIWQLIAWVTGDLPEPPSDDTGSGSSESGASSEDGTTTFTTTSTTTTTTTSTTTSTTAVDDGGTSGLGETSGSSGAGAAGDDGAGCGCDQTRERSSAIAGLFFLLVLRRRSRLD
ncbi:MAG TPA: M14 family zinc carboxypeptidase [Nannocystaceae bacterium]|nr:M14 family zinc carboxypeptidase [Nannocystaceae bacterium]